ncbi:hypothetical protein LX15_005505 [Streptoalloteichus tenebrarius]|uniref:Secreted protein n=1 Tax=Streptoalloteichus tenebrarius (strain ATCC 17920 / DSM 40477 / JCM 4838 / CBS 697.72 / NBRC 16177 / NCIMB 11028 / NRRL B-12390 / A12253. 1 / ISP 5477) TaxID=1933 RepID=A0ABT1I1W5_STRSD|nr:hypothetical protein [Streptoalloteichus tenebrarius]MCP2261779.1 hypothetical protein [Streptoalloteichus tenebrarius]BFF00836.1 hypothetical protein GCM10020241_25110 [Streptoalloteichus tenebrarius]
MGVRFYLTSVAAVLLSAVVGVWIGALVAAVRAEITRQGTTTPVVVEITVSATTTPTPTVGAGAGAPGSPEPDVGRGG